ncbi:MAG: ABC transporter ATP-binding protein [Dehalococcoidia bacterium]|nr:ABC transporter ATP-binding protein [Dehalococcoidia bacterium]
MSEMTTTRPELTQAALEAAPPGRLKDDPILITFGMLKTFGGIRAVDIDHLEIERGTITAIIGPNGAGKTTLFNLLTGFDRPDHGSWRLDGRRLGGLPPHRIARLGMVRTFQLTRSLSRLTVLENMAVAAQTQRGERLERALLRWLWQSEEERVMTRASELLDRFGIAHMADEQAGTLSGGQRKLLEMARALMTDPHMVMLDEPTAGVNPALTESLLEHIRNLNAQGVTIVFVEHNMDVVMDISDWVVVMAQGRILTEGRPEEVVANEEVIDAYLGRAHERGNDEGEPGEEESDA